MQQTPAAKKSGKTLLVGVLKSASAELDKLQTATGKEAAEIALVVTALQQGERDVLMLAALQNALAALQAVLLSKKQPVFALLTSGTQRTSAVDVIRPTHAGLFGLARTARAEEGFGACTVDGSGDLVALATSHALAKAGSEPELAVRGEKQLVPRLARLQTSVSVGMPEGPSTQLITGGTGGLGLLTARWMAQTGAAQAVVLVSRGGVLASDMASDVEQLQKSGAQWLGARGDMSQVADGRHIIAQVRQGQLPRLRGLVHAAGVLADGMLAKQTYESLSKSFGAKVGGFMSLHGLLSASELHTCLLFSSVTAMLGGGGQANYAAANCSLDSMAGSERAKKSQSQGVRFNEATHINGSLLTFGNVVHALAEKQMHVPFRDSMLTKLLESSLSGRSRTALIVCVAPETEHAHESITSLELAARCMRVESRPIVYSADVEVDPSVFIRGLEEASGTTALHRLNETHQLLSKCAQSERAATDAEKARLNELLNKEMQARVAAEESLRAVEKSLQAVKESLRLEQVKVTKMEEEHHEALSRVRTSEDHASKKRNDELRELILRERADHAAEEARLREVNKHEEQKHAAETASLHEAKKSAEARVHEPIERERTERATMEIKYRELVDRAKTERTIEKAQCVRTLRENLVREKSECAATVKRLSELLQKQEAEFAMESNELREHISNERAEHAASENALKSKVDNLESSLASALAELAGERDVCCKLQNELAHAVESATKAENRAIMQGVAIDALQLEITTEREAAQSATRNAAKELEEERANTRALEVKIVAERAERDTERAKIIADHARRVRSLEAEASAAKSENEKHAAVRDAMRQELHILRSTWRNDLARII